MTPYQKYQLEWMLAHNKSLDDLIAELDLFVLEDTANLTDEQNMPADINLHRAFSKWQLDSGFSGELWVCEDEFNNSAESEPAINAAVLPITMDILNDAVANSIDFDNEVKDRLTIEDYQHIANIAVEQTFNREEIINPLLSALYNDIETATEEVLRAKMQ